jgi:hypothetical protein
MIRTLARFDDARRARGALRALVAASFSGDDVHLHALMPDGSRVGVPIGVRSHAGIGALIGVLVTVPLGIWLGLQYGVPVVSAAIGMGGVGVIVGATVGLGSWSVVAGRPPREATALVVTVEAPAGRVEHARAVLRAAGGVDASLQEV